MSGSPNVALDRDVLAGVLRRRLRIRAARFPPTRRLEEFDFTFQRSVKKQVIEHLGQLDFLHAKQNVILFGPPGTGKTQSRSRSGSARASPANG